MAMRSPVRRSIAATVVLACAIVASCNTAQVARRGPGYQYYVSGNPADVVRATRGLWVAQGGGDDVDENYVAWAPTAAAATSSCCAPPAPTTTTTTSSALSLRLGRDDRLRQGCCNYRPVRDRDHPQCRGTLHRRRRPVKLHPLLERHAGRGCHQPRRGEASTDRRDQRRHGSHGRIRLLRGGRGKPDVEVALADPYAPDLTLARDFLALPGLENVITDQHLQERDRIGRTVALLARLQQDGWSAKPRAIAADRETAVHIDPATGIGGGLRDRRPPDALRLFHGAEGRAARLRARQAAYDRGDFRVSSRARGKLRPRQLAGHRRHRLRATRTRRRATIVARKQLLIPVVGNVPFLVIHSRRLLLYVRSMPYRSIAYLTSVTWGNH